MHHVIIFFFFLNVDSAYLLLNDWSVIATVPPHNSHAHHTFLCPSIIKEIQSPWYNYMPTIIIDLIQLVQLHTLFHYHLYLIIFGGVIPQVV